MTWNYRVYEEIKRGVSLFCIIEVYYDENGNIDGWIAPPHDPLSEWNDYQELRVTWELIEEAFKQPVVKLDKKGVLYEGEKRTAYSKRNLIKKRIVPIRLDEDVLEWINHKGSGYYTKVNAILRQAMLQAN